MNWGFQRKQIKPTAKCCDWCKNFTKDFDCEFPRAKRGQLTHRLTLKMMNEGEFRYCKNYRYSKVNFKAYKKICEENAKATNYFDF